MNITLVAALGGAAVGGGIAGGLQLLSEALRWRHDRDLREEARRNELADRAEAAKREELRALRRRIEQLFQLAREEYHDAIQRRRSTERFGEKLPVQERRKPPLARAGTTQHSEG